MAVSLHPTTRPCYIPHWLPSRPPLIISVLRSETVSWMDMHLIQFTRNFLERSPYHILLLLLPFSAGWRYYYCSALFNNRQRIMLN